MRRLAPAKLDGRGKGDLIALITTDVELLEDLLRAHHLTGGDRRRDQRWRSLWRSRSSTRGSCRY